MSEKKIQQKAWISHMIKVHEEYKNFKWCGIVGIITDIQDNKITIDFGEEKVTVDELHVYGIRE